MRKVFLEKGRYVDSVTLMGVGVRLEEQEYVLGSECGMATKQNIELLEEEGYSVPADATKNDLMIAVEAESEEALEKAHQAALSMLLGGGKQQQPGAGEIVFQPKPPIGRLRRAAARLAQGVLQFD